MLALRLPAEIEKRLADLAMKTGHTKSFFAREAILAYLDDMESLYVAKKRLKKPGKIYTLNEVESMLGLDNSAGGARR